MKEWEIKFFKLRKKKFIYLLTNIDITLSILKIINSFMNLNHKNLRTIFILNILIGSLTIFLSFLNILIFLIKKISNFLFIFSY